MNPVLGRKGGCGGGGGSAPAAGACASANSAQMAAAGISRNVTTVILCSLRWVATSDLDGIAVDGVLGVGDLGGDPQIGVGPDGDITTARVGLDVDLVHIQACLPLVVERHVRQWQIHDHAGLDHSLAEPGPAAGVTQVRGGLGPVLHGDLSVW